MAQSKSDLRERTNLAEAITALGNEFRREIDELTAIFVTIIKRSKER